MKKLPHQDRVRDIIELPYLITEGDLENMNKNYGRPNKIDSHIDMNLGKILNALH